MATNAQINANRSNAALSTGPRTPEGKLKSSQNNLRHGFRSQSVLLPGDDPAEYEALLGELCGQFTTGDLVELRCVREMADAEWRLRRVRLHQETILTRKIDELAPLHPEATPVLLQVLAAEALPKELATCLRYEAKFERQYDRAYRTWTAHQKNKPSPINLIRKMPDEPNLTPRNAPCPCGSGQKHKRCCGNPPPPSYSRSPQPGNRRILTPNNPSASRNTVAGSGTSSPSSL